MAFTPYVSVLIPAYNAARYLAESIESILLQSWPDLECVILDGGSEDATADIARAYAVRDKRVRLESFPGIHPTRRVDTIIPQLESRYVAMQHADDISYTNRIARQIQAFQTDPELGVCSALARNFWHDRMQMPRAEGLARHPRPEKHEHIKASLPFWWVMHSPSLMYDRSKIMQAGLKLENKYKFCNDYWQTVSNIDKLKYTNIQEELSAYRMHWDGDGPRNAAALAGEVKDLKKSILTHFGFDFTQRQLDIHTNFNVMPDNSVGATTPEGYDEAIAWLIDMHTQNDVKNIFDKPFFTMFVQILIKQTQQLKAQNFP